MQNDCLDGLGASDCDRLLVTCILEVTSFTSQQERLTVESVRDEATKLFNSQHSKKELFETAVATIANLKEGTHHKG